VGNGRRERAAAAGGGRRWSSCSGAAGARLGAWLGPVDVLGGGNYACVLGLVADGGEGGARRRASLETTACGGGSVCRGRGICASREAGAALKAARGQGSRHGQRGYGVGQAGSARTTAARRSRCGQRGFRDVPAVQGTLGHGHPGEYARRVGERAVRGPDAEA
jgi:hypothetical protein